MTPETSIEELFANEEDFVAAKHRIAEALKRAHQAGSGITPRTPANKASLIDALRRANADAARAKATVERQHEHSLNRITRALRRTLSK